MTKTILFILGASFLLGLSAFSIQQYAVSSEQKPAFAVSAKQVAIKTKFPDQEKKALQISNAALLQENQILKDSIVELQVVLFHLRQKIARQKKTILNIQSKMKVILTDYAVLKQEISQLSRQEQVDREKIKQLESEKAKLRHSLEALILAEEKQQKAKAQTQEIIERKQFRENKYLELSNIIKNTQITYQKISIRKKRMSRPLTKIVKGQKAWRYTLLEFYLDNEHIQSILDKNFKLKIVDIDTYEVLSYIETNPTFPNSQNDTKGIGFSFDGNLIELSYQNNQNKVGKNYELQVYYVAEDGKEYLLANGTRQFIKNRKAIGL